MVHTLHTWVPPLPYVMVYWQYVCRCRLVSYNEEMMMVAVCYDTCAAKQLCNGKKTVCCMYAHERHLSVAARLDVPMMSCFLQAVQVRVRLGLRVGRRAACHRGWCLPLPREGGVNTVPVFFAVRNLLEFVRLCRWASGTKLTSPHDPMRQAHQLPEHDATVPSRNRYRTEYFRL